MAVITAAVQGQEVAVTLHGNEIYLFRVSRDTRVLCAAGVQPSYRKTRLMEHEPGIEGCGTVLLLIVSLLVPLFLSNISPTTPSMDHASSCAGSLPEGLGLMSLSLYCLGRVARSTHESVLKSQSANEASIEGSGFEKWKASELFKVKTQDDVLSAMARSVSRCG